MFSTIVSQFEPSDFYLLLLATDEFNCVFNSGLGVQTQNLHAKQLLSDSLRCSILSATTPQKIGGTQQQPVYHNEFGACLNYEVYDEFEPSSRTNCPKCMTSMIEQINPLLPCQTTRSISQVSVKDSLKQPSNEDLIYLSFLNRHSITAHPNCKVQPILEAMTNKPTENSSI
ncbi:unnamed protein product [Schistosoma curassoni]|uniref:Gnk2-homologous domain-containing protein n=1 Tax=Schistosoma curassoni TaxID=6186 RepID=A0A183KNX2_9TREM|nr:unnamed protein product [Schistosoma curassoni]